MLFLVISIYDSGKSRFIKIEYLGRIPSVGKNFLSSVSPLLSKYEHGNHSNICLLKDYYSYIPYYITLLDSSRILKRRYSFFLILCRTIYETINTVFLFNSISSTSRVHFFPILRAKEKM